MRRRHVMRAGLVAGTGFLLGVPVLTTGRPAHANEPSPRQFGQLRERWARMQTGENVDPSDPDIAAAIERIDSEAVGWAESIIRDQDRTDLWADLPLPGNASGAFALTSSYQRLRQLAVAWSTPGSRLHGDDRLIRDIVSGLELLNRLYYREDGDEPGNWWHWEIGIPRALVDTIAMVHPQVPSDLLGAQLRAIDRYCPNPDRRTNYPSLSETGANRADKCVIVAVRGVLGENDAKVRLARDGLSDTRDSGRNSIFRYVTSGDGFYVDGSFVQHDYIAYTGTYGSVLLGSVARTIALLAGSAWEVDDPDRTVVFDAVDRSFAPVMPEMLMMDSVRGRAISRERARDVDDGRGAASNILRLADGAPEPYASSARGLVKGWLRRGDPSAVVEHLGIPDIVRVKELLRDSGIPAEPRRVGTFVLADMDRVVHHRPTWSFAISMSSERIAINEAGNGENLRGWYLGDGMTYLYDRDVAQYNDDFWPTVDPYRLPGTTIDTRERQALDDGWSSHRPDTPWAGGAALDPGMAAVGMELLAYGSSLWARKSWFVFDDFVVALGAGIDSTDGRPIETVVENRNLHADGENALHVDGDRQPSELGWQDRFADPGWAHLEDVGGYVFLESGTVRISRETRTGSWHDIGTGNEDRPTTRRYLTMCWEHGTNPDDDAYGYALIPGASAAETRRFAESDRVDVLANHRTVQAVRADDRYAFTFWTGDSVPVADGDLWVDGPCSVLVVEEDDELRIGVADPTRTFQRLELELPWSAVEVLDADSTVAFEPGGDGGKARLSVRVGGSRGGTHRAVLRAGHRRAARPTP